MDGYAINTIVAGLTQRPNPRFDCAVCGDPIDFGDGAVVKSCDGQTQVTAHAWCVVTCPGEEERYERLRT